MKESGNLMGCGLNKIMVIGHLFRDPEMRFTPNGKSVSYFPIEHKHYWRNADDELQTHTERFNVIAWGNLAEVVKESLNVGDLAYVEGRLQSRTWEDENGFQHISIEIIAHNVEHLSDN